MAIDHLLVIGAEMVLENLVVLLVSHLQGMKAGSRITCEEQKMTTVGGTSRCLQWIGAIGIAEGIPSSMRGKDMKGGHPHHLQFNRFLHIMADGDVMCERGVDLQLGVVCHQKTTVEICTWIGVGMTEEGWGETGSGVHISLDGSCECDLLMYCRSL